MEIDKRYFVIGVVAAVVCLSVYDHFALFGFGFGFAVAWFIYPIFHKWFLERKKRKLEQLRKDVVRLEREVSGK